MLETKQTLSENSSTMLMKTIPEKYSKRLEEAFKHIHSSHSKTTDESQLYEIKYTKK